MSTGFFIFLAVFFALILLGMPIAIAMIVVSFFYVTIVGLSAEMLAMNMFSGLANFVLLAIPLFILTAEVMDRTKVTDKMFNFCNAAVGYMPGGLGHVNCLTSIIFAGMSGAAVADVGGIGHMCYSEMVKSGYPKEFSASVTMASSLIGPIIPPSIPMVIYSMVANVSIGRMLFGGIIPGLIMGVVLMVWVYVVSVRNNYPKADMIPWGMYFRNVGFTFLKGLPALLTPVVLLGGIYGGVVTSTEAAALAALYALFLGGFLYRTLSFKDFVQSFKSVFIKCGAVLLVISAAKAFGFVLTNENIQTNLQNFMISFGDGSKVITVGMLMFLFLILGCLSDPTVNIMLFGPMAAGLAQAVGMDPIHFGVVLILNAMIGNITPPVGSVLMAVCSLEKLNIQECSRALVTPLLLLVGVLGFILIVPGTVTWIPNMLLG